MSRHPYPSSAQSHEVMLLKHPDMRCLPLLRLPLFGSSVQAGFPSPADDYIEHHLDLNNHLIRHPAATFFVTAQQDVSDTPIKTGDLLIIDRSLHPSPNKLVLAIINERLVIRRVINYHGLRGFQSDEHEPLFVSDNDEADWLWGVVTHIIHRAF